MEYTITARNGDSVKVESENWMIAMGKALAFFDIDISSLGRLTCTSNEPGSVFVEDGDGKRSWMVRAQSPEFAVRVTPKSAREQWEPIKNEPSVSEADLTRPRPELRMPVESSLKKDEPQTLAEHLFEISMESDAIPVNEVCDMALAALLPFAKAEAGCVARGTLNDAAMKVVAARGPRAVKFVDREVAFGEGLIGMCFDMRGTLAVNDVASDTPHLDLVEAGEAGMVSVLCVPIIDDEDTTTGVIQLVNPPSRPFTQQSVEVAETVARTLATALAGR